VDTLIRTTRHLREGHLSARAELKEIGELGELSRSFDDMAEDLQIREQELRASKQTVEAVLASSPVAIITLNREGKVTLWTPAAERLLGWSAEEVLGREVPFTVPEQAPGSRGLGAVLAAGEPFMDVECTGVHREGRRLELSVSSLPLTKPDGTVTGQVVAVADLTTRRQLERQLQQSQQLEAIGRLAGGVAHDFSNLLTVIQGLSESVLDRPGLDAAARHDLEGVRQAASRGSELTGQLLAFSRRQAAQPRVVDLNALVAGMTGMLRRLIGEDIQLETRLEARPGQIEADPAQIEQALTYLLVNARDAMPKGGKLVIETANQACADREGRRCKGGCQGTCVTLAVSDTGAGMDAEALEHVFEPFFSTGGRTHGKGLGLAAVYGIVQQCGGDIEVASEPGRGSTFRIFIPRVASTRPGAPDATDAQDAARTSNTVLLVEDEEGVREVARAALEKAGYRVLEARQGQEALEVAGRHEGPIALLLTDVVMPVMGGPELARQLRQFLPGIRVLYISGYAPGEGGRQAARLDAPFLAKPFRPGTLVGKVREVLEADRAGAS
jgi:PAS domain S-box-containing protein